jgi:exodeoxyribonuclease-5
MKLSKEQQKVMDGIIQWFNDAKEQWLVVSGYAGTGKTTLLSFLPKLLPDTTRITFNTYTGKASSVLSNKLSNANVWNVNVSTIHKLMYQPIIKSEEDGTEYIEGWEKVEEIPYDLIVIDEASMVNQEMFEDLLSYDKPVLCIGDKGQLPPIFSDKFCLMNNPDFSLETIHRQAEGSPIIKLSKFIRENGVLPKNLTSYKVKTITWWKKEDREFFNKIPWDNINVMGLCSFNRTRKSLNFYIRQLLGYHNDNLINKGERIVCLKNNEVLDKKVYYVMNGMTAIIENVYSTPHSRLKNLTIKMDHNQEKFKCLSDVRSFGEINIKKLGKISGDPRNKNYAKVKKQKNVNLFDYGNIITVHKAQGSEWPCICLVDERNEYISDKMYCKWLYTAITRASQKIIVIKDYL